MFAFLLCLILILLGALLWLSHANRPRRNSASSFAAQAPLAQVQARGLDGPIHLNDPTFAQLLRAARGNRSQIEAWILAEQRYQPQLSRDQAIRQVAAKLIVTRSV